MDVAEEEIKGPRVIWNEEDYSFAWKRRCSGSDPSKREELGSKKDKMASTTEHEEKTCTKGESIPDLKTQNSPFQLLETVEVKRDIVLFREEHEEPTVSRTSYLNPTPGFFDIETQAASCEKQVRLQGVDVIQHEKKVRSNGSRSASTKRKKRSEIYGGNLDSGMKRRFSIHDAALQIVNPSKESTDLLQNFWQRMEAIEPSAIQGSSGDAKGRKASSSLRESLHSDRKSGGVTDFLNTLKPPLEDAQRTRMSPRTLKKSLGPGLSSRLFRILGTSRRSSIQEQGTSIINLASADSPLCQVILVKDCRYEAHLVLHYGLTVSKGSPEFQVVIVGNTKLGVEAIPTGKMVRVSKEKFDSAIQVEGIRLIFAAVLQK